MPTKTPKKPAAKSRKAPAAKKPAATTSKVRRVKQSPYRSFRLAPRIRSTAKPVPSVFGILRDARGLLFGHRRLFLGILAIYFLLMAVLVKGFHFGINLAEIKTALQDVNNDKSGVATSFTLFGALLGSATSTSGEGTALIQSFLFLLMSLVIIWALRQSHAGIKVTIKESFYKSTYPLVPFIGILVIIAIQFIPTLIASYLYGLMFLGGNAVTAVEHVLWAIILFLLVLWSFYMIVGSAFAMYIVTLPDVMPLQALRSARELVQHRRWMLMRKLIFLPFLYLTVGAIIMVPVILFVTPIAEFTFFCLSIAALIFTHAYMYSLYRRLM